MAIQIVYVSVLHAVLSLIAGIAERNAPIATIHIHLVLANMNSTHNDAPTLRKPCC
jgi:hypothetical protein